MITEHQQDMASLYALGSLPPDERSAFEEELQDNPALLGMVRDLEKVAALFAARALTVKPRPGLKEDILRRIGKLEGRESDHEVAPALHHGLAFAHAPGQSGWKPLPVPGTYIKLLSLEKERGYAVLLGKLDPGARYPEHQNSGPEDFYILSGDLVIGDHKLAAGDFHHADAGSLHEENHSVNGCTLLAVLTSGDPLVAFALG